MFFFQAEIRKTFDWKIWHMLFFRFVRHLERFRISVTDTFHIQAPYVTSMEKKLLNQMDTKFQMIELFRFLFRFLDVR